MMKKKVVLIFLGDFLYDARCQNMADTIIDSGSILHIIHTGKSLKKYRNSIINHISVPNSGLMKYLHFFLNVKKIVKKLKPNIIIASDLYSLPAAHSYRANYLVYDSRELYTHLAGLNNKPIKQYIWSLIEKIYINKVDSILVTAPGDKVILNTKYDNLNINVIYNYPSIYMKPQKTSKLREKLNIDNSSTIFLYQGVLHKGRGIKSMLQILDYFNDTYAVIIGDGPYKFFLKEYISKKSISDKVFFIKSVPYKELLNLSAEADIGFSLIKPISISYKQALPNKLFEYALAGLPIIASNLPEIKKIINKYPIGYCVPFNDINEQIKFIKKILQDKMGENIQNIAAKNLVWENQKINFLNSISINEKS